MITLFLILLAVHALCDFPLQGDYLAKAKADSYVAMSAHSLIHALGVYVATGEMAFFLAEFVLHFAIDSAKVRGKLTFNQDQLLHVLCKVAYVAVAFAVQAHAN